MPIYFKRERENGCSPEKHLMWVKQQPIPEDALTPKVVIVSQQQARSSALSCPLQLEITEPCMISAVIPSCNGQLWSWLAGWVGVLASFGFLKDSNPCLHSDLLEES